MKLAVEDLGSKLLAGREHTFDYREKSYQLHSQKIDNKPAEFFVDYCSKKELENIIKKFMATPKAYKIYTEYFEIKESTLDLCVVVLSEGEMINDQIFSPKKYRLSGFESVQKPKLNYKPKLFKETGMFYCMLLDFESNICQSSGLNNVSQQEILEQYSNLKLIRLYQGCSSEFLGIIHNLLPEIQKDTEKLNELDKIFEQKIFKNIQ
jgi:hypothetical protein